MAKLSKKRKEALAKYDKTQSYSVAKATEILKEISYTKFDASVDIDVRLGVDPRKADQMVRGVVALPHGTGKDVRVLVLCTPDKEEEARAAVADVVRGAASSSVPRPVPVAGAGRTAEDDARWNASDHGVAGESLA